MRINGVRGDFF